MRTLVIAAATLCAAGCDPVPFVPDAGVPVTFVGSWTGNGYSTTPGGPSMAFGPAPDMVIGRQGANQFVLGACPFGGGSIPATAIDDANLDIAAHGCPQIHFGQDCVVPADISGGTANLRGPLLTVQVVGHVGLCDGGTQDYFGNFSGAK